MPKLKDAHISIKANDGEHYDLHAAMSVTNDGEFSLTLPEELVEIAHASNDNSAAVIKDRKYTKVKGNTQRACINYFRARMLEYFNFETKEEIVIVYAFHSDYAICEDPETGEFYPNGGFIPNVKPLNGNYEWHGNLNATTKAAGGGYSIKLYAKILKKITYIRSTSNKITFERAKCEPGSYADLLNGFISCDELSTVWNSRDAETKEIPYTEDAAEFFYRSLIGIAKIGHTLTERFSTNESVMEMIENKNMPLLITDKGN